MSFTARFHEVAAEVRNWGRWGGDDRLGTLNLLTDEVVAAGAATIRSGRRVSLALPLSRDGVQLGQVPGRVNPLRSMHCINRLDGLRYLIKRQSEQAALVTLLRRRPS